jgi:hypothetical protein
MCNDLRMPEIKITMTTNKSKMFTWN